MECPGGDDCNVVVSVKNSYTIGVTWQRHANVGEGRSVHASPSSDFRPVMFHIVKLGRIETKLKLKFCTQTLLRINPQTQELKLDFWLTFVSNMKQIYFETDLIFHTYRIFIGWIIRITMPFPPIIAT